MENPKVCATLDSVSTSHDDSTKDAIMYKKATCKTNLCPHQEEDPPGLDSDQSTTQEAGSSHTICDCHGISAVQMFDEGYCESFQYVMAKNMALVQQNCKLTSNAATSKQDFSHYSITYSDSKNWFTFGKNFLARSIVAQKTKLNSWESLITKQSIMSWSGPNIKTSVLLIDLIQDLQ